jgi:hypothetical protein
MTLTKRRPSPCSDEKKIARRWQEALPDLRSISMHINNKHGDKTQQQASMHTRYVLMTGTLAIDFRAARQICCRGAGAVAQLAPAQLTLLSRKAAIAILEAASKQMHVCALLHNNVNRLSLIHQPACFFCWLHQPELPAAFLLLACVLVVVPAAG